MQLAPSKHPEKESKNFAVAALICGIASLVIWFIGVAGLAFGIRAAIISKRIKNTKYLTFSLVGAVLSLISLIYYYAQ